MPKMTQQEVIDRLNEAFEDSIVNLYPSPTGAITIGVNDPYLVDKPTTVRVTNDFFDKLESELNKLGFFKVQYNNFKTSFWCMNGGELAWYNTGMKVKIITGRNWYSSLVGSYFSVIVSDLDSSWYGVRNPNGEKGHSYYVDKSDCEVVK